MPRTLAGKPGGGPTGASQAGPPRPTPCAAPPPRRAPPPPHSPPRPGPPAPRPAGGPPRHSSGPLAMPQRSGSCRVRSWMSTVGHVFQAAQSPRPCHDRQQRRAVSPVSQTHAVMPPGSLPAATRRGLSTSLPSSSTWKHLTTPKPRPTHPQATHRQPARAQAQGYAIIKFIILILII